MARNKALGGQVYLSYNDREVLLDLLELSEVRLTDEIRDLRDELHWSIRRYRERGAEPKRSDFDPRLPHPETDFQAAHTRWGLFESSWRRSLKEIREVQKRRAHVRRLFEKLVK